MAIALIVLGALAASAGFVYYACWVPRSQVLGRALVRGSTKGRRIALTFDDGPAPPFTEQILDVLRDYGAPATFFVCGENVERQPETLRRIAAEGHTIGNHTHSHPLLALQSSARIEREIGRAQAAVERVIGKQPRLFRAPYGVRGFGLFPVLRAHGLKAIQWSDTGFDWIEKHSAADIARLALAGLRPGAVILLHDGRNALPPEQVDRSRTVAALPAIIEGARAAGFTFVSVEDLIA